MKVDDKIKLKEKFSINFNPRCTPDMLKFEGKIVTVDYIYGNSTRKREVFKIKEDKGMWFWSTDYIDKYYIANDMQMEIE